MPDMAVGQNVFRKEGFEKLTGAARYVDDVALEGMLFGKTVRSGIPRGLIKAIIFDPDYDWSRVVIADYRDIPGENYVALIENDQPLLAESEIRHCEEPILLIAAESKHEAEIAARHVSIEYDERAIVIQTTTGGGFGGKEEYPSMIAAHAALLAYKAQRPVKMIYDRAEDIAATPKRHPGIIRHRAGVMSDGRLVASEIDIVFDGGAYEVTALKITTAQDIGRAIHPVMAAGQIEGGTLQAVGYGLFEELIWERGRVVNNRLTNYIIPTSLDAPEMETIIVEKEYPHGPFGAKGVGELPMDGAAPAIAAAIFNATGAFVTEIPITPERLMAAVENMSAP